MPSSKTKTAHLIHVRHRDEVEPPMTDWLREAYEFSEIDSRRFAGIVARKQAPASALRAAAGKARGKRAPAKKKKTARKTAKKR